MPDRSRKRPRDPNVLAKRLVDEATGAEPKYDPDEGKDPAAVALGRKGGLKGGKARAAKMTPEERSEAARKAAAARWSVSPQHKHLKRSTLLSGCVRFNSHAMANSDEHIRRAIKSLEIEKQDLLEQVRLVEIKISQLGTLLRLQGRTSEFRPREPGEPAKRGEAEQEIVQLLSMGQPFGATEIAARRGTSPNAASNVLRRLHKRGAIEKVGTKYQAKAGVGSNSQASLALEGG